MIRTDLSRALLGILFLAVAAGPLQAQVFDATDTPLSIPPAGTSGTTVSVIIDPAAEGSCVEDIDVIIEATHSFVGDLDARLQHDETGTVVQLFNPAGGSASLTGGPYVFDDEAAGAWFAGAGSYAPVAPLSDFDGESLAGTWTLIIDDNLGGDSGTLTRFAIDVDAGDTLLECEGFALFSVDTNRYVFPSNGPIFLLQQNGYAQGRVSGNVELRFDGAALGLSSLDCIHEQDDGLFVFSTGTVQFINTPSGWTQLWSQNAYRLEADGNVTVVFDGVALGATNADACHIDPGAAAGG